MSSEQQRWHELVRAVPRRYRHIGAAWTICEVESRNLCQPSAKASNNELVEHFGTVVLQGKRLVVYSCYVALILWDRAKLQASLQAFKPSRGILHNKREHFLAAPERHVAKHAAP